MQLLISQPILRQRTDLEVFYQNVATGDQLQRDLLPLQPADIECHRLLVAVHPEVVRRPAVADRLAARLKSLVASGILERREYQATRFEYYLTESGRQLRPVLLALSEWGSVWAQDPPTATFDHDCGEILEIEQVCRHCGRPVEAADMRLHVAAAG